MICAKTGSQNTIMKRKRKKEKENGNIFGNLFSINFYSNWLMPGFNSKLYRTFRKAFKDWISLF